MQRRLLLLWIVILPWGPIQGQDPAVESINRYIGTEMKRQQIPGLSVAVLRGDQVLLARGYGYANLELGVPASDSTVYQSGSVGKQFTAAAVLMLADEGRLRLDDRVVRWLPEGIGVWDSIRVRHLLSHTSGIREYTDSTFDYRKDYTEDQLVRFASARPLDFPPGERWAYSNTGYFLLGALVHRVTGQFYGEILQRLIFLPLGMRTTRIISEADLVPNRAAGYRLVAGTIKNQEWVAPTLNTTADGSLYFSISDLIRWAISLNRGRIPKAELLRTAWIPVRLNDGGFYPYGFGWSLIGQRGHQRIGHTGSWQGFKTAIHRYPEFKLTVIVLANLAQAESGSIAESIAGILEPALLPPQRFSTALSGSKPPLSLDQLLARVAEGTSVDLTTRSFDRLWSRDARQELREQLEPLKSWSGLGCDSLVGGGISWLGAPVQWVCYARGTGPAEQVIASVFFSRDWLATHLEISQY